MFHRIRCSLAVPPLTLLVFLIAFVQRDYAQSPRAVNTGYVGSQECALCHADIFETYSKTDMGRSMAVAQTTLAHFPRQASVFEPRLNRHFNLSSGPSDSTQSEYQLAPDGRELFRETEKIGWILGAGTNCIKSIVRRGEYLFEAPLSFYSSTNSWALSPGYEKADYGFSRPLGADCVACHSGRPQAILSGNGRFRNPPFLELAIGCENCHGPGEAHIAAASPGTIVNPAKLSALLADNLCLECHQTGGARVLGPGKDYSDFVPGEELNRTLSIFVVPLSRNAAPKDELLEPDLSMRLSRCYRGSEGKLKCITCHDPHRQPAAAEAPAYFRGRCLICHNEQSCSRPLAERQKLSPPDSCIGCHMPKRDTPAVYHSALTNHRIVKAPQEPFPEVAYQMTTPELPDLVQLSAAPGSHAAPPPLMLLQAYRQIVPAHPEYRERHWSLARKLETSNGDDIAVLEALADAWSQDKSQNGIEREINYLERARAQGTTQPADFEELGSLLLAGGRWDKAIAALQQGIERVPFDQELYRLLRQAYFLNRDLTNACKVSKDANRLFSQDEGARTFEMNHCSVTAP